MIPFIHGFITPIKLPPPTVCQNAVEVDLIITAQRHMDLEVNKSPQITYWPMIWVRINVFVHWRLLTFHM